MKPHQKENLLNMIKLVEATSHYRIGTDSFDCDIIRVLNPWASFLSYKGIIKQMNDSFGLRKDQVDYLVCVNDACMRWERKEKLLKILKGYLNADS